MASTPAPWQSTSLSTASPVDRLSAPWPPHAPPQWFEFNDSTVSALSESEVKKAFGGATTSYMGYASTSSTSAYMLMYRRVDPTLNITAVGASHVPTYIKDDLAKEQADKKAAAEVKKAESKAKIVSAAALKNQTPFMVCHADQIHCFRPEQTDGWGAAKTAVFEALGLGGVAPADIRLCRCVLRSSSTRKGRLSCSETVPLFEARGPP